MRHKTEIELALTFLEILNDVKLKRFRRAARDYPYRSLLILFKKLNLQGSLLPINGMVDLFGEHVS